MLQRFCYGSMIFLSFRRIVISLSPLSRYHCQQFSFLLFDTYFIKRTYTHTYTHMHPYIHTRTHAYTNADAHTQTHVHNHVQTCTHLYTHTHTITHALALCTLTHTKHTCTHTHTHIQSIVDFCEYNLYHYMHNYYISSYTNWAIVQSLDSCF